MRKNRLLAMSLVICSLVACAPSPQTIQTATKNEQSILPPTPTSTYTPDPTATNKPLPSDTPFLITTPSTTPTNVPETETPELKSGTRQYIVEAGICLVSISVSTIIQNGYETHPGDYPGCIVSWRRLIPVGYDMDMPLSTDMSTDSGYETWCTLKLQDGTFIMGAFDTIGQGFALCHTPKQ
jgi:hypothetical protein